MLGNEPGLFVSNPGALISTLPDDPDNVLFARWSSRARVSSTQRVSRISRKQDSGYGYALFRVNLKNGKRRTVDSGKYDTVDWLVDADGEPIARIDYNPANQTKSVYLKNGSKFERVSEWKQERGFGSYSFHGMTDKPDIALATSYVGDKIALMEFNLRTGQPGAIVFQNPKYDLDGITYDPVTMKVVAARYTDNLPRTTYFEKETQAIQDNLRAALPQAEPLIVSQSADKSKIVVRAVYVDHPSQYFIFDQNARKLNMIATTYGKLDGLIVAKKEQYNYRTADGFSIDGFLTVPKGRTKQNMPLVVLPHGGPETRSSQAFDYWAFFYAARGYLVYEPNFRGSYGYGGRFRSAGYGEWGRKMQDDITDGVNKLIADGIVDKDRICIVGGSYGGYAALAGATLTPNLYSCAVSVNGVSNLAGMLGSEARSNELAEDYWTIRIGNRFKDTAELDAVSPSKIAAQAGPPIQLIHAKDDIVVPVAQSMQMRDALEAAGKPHEFIELDGEDHWLSTGAARTEMLAASIEFIDRHIGQ